MLTMPALRLLMIRGVGLVLLGSAIAKTMQMATLPILTVPALAWQSVMNLVVAVEVVLGLWLLRGFWSARINRFTIALFSTFAVITTGKAVLGHASCGCFGAVAVPPVYTAVFDVLVVTGALLVRLPDHPPSERVLRGSLLLGLFVALATCGWTVDRYVHRPLPITSTGDAHVVEDVHLPGSGLVILEPETWIGKRLVFPATVPGHAAFLHGRWRLILVRPDCPDCHHLLRSLTSPARGSPPLPCAVLALPATGAPMDIPLPPDVQMHRLDPTCAWFVTTPTILDLVDGVVAQVRAGPGITLE